MSSNPASETVGSRPQRRYLLVVAGLLAAAAAWGAMSLSLGPVEIPPSDEAIALGSDFMNQESVDKAEALLLEIDEQNVGRMLAMLFGFCAAIFGASEGLRRGSFGGAVTGLLVGGILGGVAGWLLGPPVRTLQGYMTHQQFDGLVMTMVVHSVIWFIAAVVIAIAIGSAAFSLARTAEVGIAAIVGGVVGALIFAFAAGMFFGVAPTENARFVGFIPQLLWAAVPTVLIGLFVARATGVRHVKSQDKAAPSAEPASAEPA